MNAAQFASWERRLDHILADPRPDADALHLLFGEMAAALYAQSEGLRAYQSWLDMLRKKLERERERAERVIRMAALRCVQLQPDLKALTRHEDQFAALAPGRDTLPAEGLAALLRRNA